MTFWQKLLVLLGIWKPKPPKPPEPPATTYRPVAIITKPIATVKLDGAAQVLGGSPIVGVTNQDGYYCWTHVPTSIGPSHVWVNCAGYEDYNSHVELSQGASATNHDIWIGGGGTRPIDINLPPLTPVKPPQPVYKQRKGIVRANGKHWVDDDGEFFPLGATLFWAIRGWKDEQQRIKDNITFLAKYGFNYMRVLAQVDWKDGLATDPTWPDYEKLFTELIDWAYDECGVRTQITIFGGGSQVPPSQLVDTCIRIANGRPHKIHLIEIANEYYINFNDEAKLKEFSKRVKSQTQNLCTVSDPGKEIESQESGKWVTDGVATCGTAHYDRNDSTIEQKWRHVRRAWEGRQPSFPYSSNEPGGPHSSVAQYPHVIHLAFCRLVGILCGQTDYLLHNGNGIFGVALGGDGGRKPNLWECEDIDRIMSVLRSLEQFIPTDAPNGTNTRKGLGPHPLETDMFVSDNGDHGCVRDYAIVNGDHWWQTVFGIKNYVNLKANVSCQVTFIDPVSGQTKEVLLNAGQTYRLEPDTRDQAGWGAWIVRGQFL